jgi:hypothetical protein
MRYFLQSRKRIGIAFTVLLFTYTVSYSALYSFRGPAANLMYFVYITNPNAFSIEKPLYLLFYPIYKLHRTLGCGPHNFDRPDPIDLPEVL